METVQSIKQRFEIIGNDPKLNRAIEKAIQVAPTDISVLVIGESGVGKESIPKIIHSLSHRKHGKYIAVNCGAIPEGTIDSELFGHEKGAFTGATSTREGYFEVANGGTIFLDEVGELPLTTQVRLLRVLENGEFIKVGSSQVQKTNVRIVAATNVNLFNAIEKGKFREDLYYRLSTVDIGLPPLRERKGDILPLVASLLLRHAPNAQAFTLSEEAQAQLLAYPWPGNVRELENVVQRAVVLCADQNIEAHHLMFDDAADLSLHMSDDTLTSQPTPSVAPTSVATATPVSRFGMPTEALRFPDTSNTEDNAAIATNLQEAVKTSEHQMILAAIQTTDSRMEAAAKLGISPRTLRYKLAKLKADNGNMAWAA